MKHIILFSLSAVCFFFMGCASTGSDESAATEDTAAEESSTGSTGAKTAYDGSTGSGLLMERYKSGQIDGFRN
jgi:hypothetical protein